jgi:hypothetical protein
VTKRTSDGLPLVYDGKAIDWDPWESSFVASHLDSSCAGCGNPGPPRLTKGRVMVPAKRRRLDDPEERPLIRFWAFRCPGCQETRVYDRVPPEGSAERMPMIEYMRPEIPMAVEPLPQATTSVRTD